MSEADVEAQKLADTEYVAQQFIAEKHTGLARAATAEARVADLERALAEAKARVLALESALRQLLDASEADYGVPDDNDSDDESVALGSDGNSKIVFGHLRRARAVLAGGAAEAPVTSPLDRSTIGPDTP